MDSKIKDELQKYAEIYENGNEIELEIKVNGHVNTVVMPTENGQKVIVKYGKSTDYITIVMNDGKDGVEIKKGKKSIGILAGYHIDEISRFPNGKKGLIVKLKNEVDEKEEESE